MSSKFEKKWLRRRFSEELRIKQSLKFFYGPIREKFFRKYLLLSLNNKTKQNIRNTDQSKKRTKNQQENQKKKKRKIRNQNRAAKARELAEKI